MTHRLKQLGVKTVVALGLGLSAWTSVEAQSLRWLGAYEFPATALAVSGDGNVIVGFVLDRMYDAWPCRAFRWTEQAGFQYLGTLYTFPAVPSSKANAVSQDGSVVVGISTESFYYDCGGWYECYETHDRAFRWTAADGMQDLGTLGGNASEAMGVSADGSVVVGWAENASGQRRAFRWTAADGMQDLGTLPGYDWSVASGVSADGSVVVGWAENANWEYRAFRWTAQGGMQDLGTLGGNSSAAYGVSADGTVIVGEASGRVFRWRASDGQMQDIGPFEGVSVANGVSDDGSIVVGWSDCRGWQAVVWNNARMVNITEVFAGGVAFSVSANGSVVVGTYNPYYSSGDYAFRWTADTGLEPLMEDCWSSDLCPRQAHAISADGSVVVGWAENASGQRRAFRRTAAGEMQDLGTLGGNWSEAYGVSADGTVVVGWARDASGRGRAFRWTAADGMQDLGTLGGNASEAMGVSADGTVVVGWARDANWEDRAFRWTAQGGMQDLGTLPGYDWSVASGVSADGTVIVGWARDANLEYRAFRWTAAGGIEDLNQTYASLLTGGSVLTRACAVSRNGRYIVGDGYNSATRRYEAFLLDTGASQVPGDVNGDGCVDDADLLAVLFNFGQSGSGLPEDVNGDGTVDDADLLEVLFNFGGGC